jgi:putative ABC transport system permease protein
MLPDLHYGARVLAKNPGFTATAIAALALGIGANTAVFSIVNAVLLTPLPYQDPSQLVAIWETDRKRGVGQNAVAPANYLDWRDRSTAFAEMAAVEISQGFNLTGLAEPERIAGARVTASLFPLLGVKPRVGRAFSESEDGIGGPLVVVLSHGLWQRRFGGERGVLGATVQLDGRSHTVIGVMPPQFRFPEHLGADALSVGFAGGPGKAPDVWVPMSFHANERQTRTNHYLAAVARLKPGTGLERAEAELKAIQARIAEKSVGDAVSDGVVLSPLQRQLVGQTRTAILLLLGAVGFVLLIACTNVANLLLAKNAARQKEIAIRAALGANRSRLVRQLMAESALLAVIGGSLGLLFAQWAIKLVLGTTGGNLPLPEALQINLDARVLGFTLALSLATGLAFGLAPALNLSKGDLSQTLKEAGGSSAGGIAGRRFRHSLIVSQVALAVVLLAGAGLMIRNFLRLTGDHPGFDAQNLLTARIGLPAVKYPETSQRTLFYRSLLDRVRTLPGVESAAAIHLLPLVGGRHHINFSMEGRASRQGGRETTAQYRVVTSDYFRTMGIAVRRGRAFTEADAENSPLVAIINEAMAKRYWQGENPVGRQLRLDARGPNRVLSIIGVAGDSKDLGLAAPPEPTIYVPYYQSPARLIGLVVRTRIDPWGLAAAVRHEVQAVDPEQPVYDVQTMATLISDSVWRSRFTMLLLSVFACVALLLAVVGLYGVVSKSVGGRRREVGIRMALGATQRSVLEMVIRQGLGLVLLGALIGLTASVALTRFMSTLLYGVSATDPLTFLGVLLVLMAAATLATYVPARRAAKVDPVVALRYE